MNKQTTFTETASTAAKPIFRRDLHKKLYTELGKVPKDWYPSLIDAIYAILGEEDGKEYFGAIQCPYCLDKSGGQVCRICPLDWQVTITDPSLHLCHQPGSVLAKIMEIEEMGCFDSLKAEVRKQLYTKLANLPLSENAKLFDVVE